MCLNKYSLHVFMSFVFLKVFTMYSMQTNICDLWLSRSRIQLCCRTIFFFFFKCSRVSLSLIWDLCYVWNKLDSLKNIYMRSMWEGKLKLKTLKGLTKNLLIYTKLFNIIRNDYWCPFNAKVQLSLSSTFSVFIKKILLDN